MNYVQVPHENLSPETLDRLVREFVLREGTDYGDRHYSLEEKIAAVKAEIASGKAVVTYDFAAESCSITPLSTVAAHQAP